MDHSAFTYLMDENGEYVTHFAYGDSIEKMTERLRRELAGNQTGSLTLAPHPRRVTPRFQHPDTASQGCHCCAAT